jgi:hypothetical protein
METLQKLVSGTWTVFTTLLGILVYIILAVIVLTYIGVIPMGEPPSDWYEETQRDPFAT